MNQEQKLRNMRVYHLERESDLICGIAYQYELKKLEKNISGIEKGNITNDDVLRRLTQ